MLEIPAAARTEVRVLIVDDSEVVRRVLKTLLEQDPSIRVDRDRRPTAPKPSS